MIYLDNHATTRCDPRVVDALVPLLTAQYANAGSLTHESGREVADRVAQACHSLAMRLGATSDELVITSGATESNNLALFGFCTHPNQQRRKLISCQTEHRAILDPLRRLEKLGFELILLPVRPQGDAQAGMIDLGQLQSVLDEKVALVSIMLANNEIGVIQPLREIAQLSHQVGAVVHTDATQAVGRITVNVDELDVDLLSFSAHKFYGPKGVGGLYVRSSPRRVRLQGQIWGGGQQANRRAGTLNSPGIIAMAMALQVCDELADTERPRVRLLRDRFYSQLKHALPELELNGPQLDDLTWRLAGNLNCSFMPIEGQSLMLAAPEICASSGSACTSSEPSPSHVLRALGLSDEQARSSLRFGIGRFNTEADIDQATELLTAAAQKLRRLI